MLDRNHTPFAVPVWDRNPGDCHSCGCPAPGKAGSLLQVHAVVSVGLDDNRLPCLSV